jgi:hypothetical protein
MFFPMNTTYSDWRNRIGAEAVARLASHGAAISNISGEKDAPPRLIVNTEKGEYAFIGDFNHNESPETVLVDLLNDSNVEMCAPVRIAALQLLRKIG